MNRSGLNYIALTSVIQSSFENRTALCSVVYAKEQKDFCDQPLKDESSIISAFERGESFSFFHDGVWATVTNVPNWF